MSKSTSVIKNGFTPFAYGRCQSLLQSTKMGSHPLLMMDVKVYYRQQEYIATFAESISIYKFNECIPENVLIIWVLTNYLLVYSVEISICILCFNKNYQTLYFELAHNKVSYVFYFKLNHHTLLFLYFVFENKYYNYRKTAVQYGCCV